MTGHLWIGLYYYTLPTSLLQVIEDESNVIITEMIES